MPTPDRASLAVPGLVPACASVPACVPALPAACSADCSCDAVIAGVLHDVADVVANPVANPVADPVAKSATTSNRSCNGPFAQGPVNRSERRRERRAALDVLANRFLEGHPYLCRATDISREGIRIHRMNEPEPERRPARFSGFQFQLPGSPDVLTASGEIVFENRDQRTLGVRFTHLSTTVARAIDRYLRQGQTCQPG